MMILSATTDNLQVVLGGAVTTNQLPCVTSWRDITTTDYTPGRTVTNTNSTTDVNIVPAPAASTQRVIDYVSIYNADTVTTTVTVKFDANGTEYVIFVADLVVGGRLDYTSDTGWTVYAPSALASLNPYFSGYSDYAAISNPSTPSAGILRMYARTIAGRTMPKWTPPSGLDTPVQPALFGNQVILFTPYNSTTVTPNGFGAIWAKGGSAGTVSTPTVSTSSPTFMNSMRRTRHANAATTTNQAMGIIANANASRQFWTGSASGLGGFFFFARFGLGIWLASSRIFAGLGGSATERVVSDTLTANSIGLWRATTDSGDTLSFISSDGSANIQTTSVSGATVATGSVFDVYIFHKGGNDGTVYFRVDQIDSGSAVTLVDSSHSTYIPANTAFLGPEVEMSNGTANTTANTVAIDVNRIYVESDH